MHQASLIDSDPVAPAPFKDVRDTRPATADRKACLVYRLRKLAAYVPLSVRGAGIMATHEWQARQAKARSVAAAVRSSEPDMTRAITALEAYLSADELLRFAVEA